MKHVMEKLLAKMKSGDMLIIPNVPCTSTLTGNVTILREVIFMCARNARGVLIEAHAIRIYFNVGLEQPQVEVCEATSSKYALVISLCPETSSSCKLRFLTTQLSEDLPCERDMLFTDCVMLVQKLQTCLHAAKFDTQHTQETKQSLDDVFETIAAPLHLRKLCEQVYQQKDVWVDKQKALLQELNSWLDLFVGNQ